VLELFVAASLTCSHDNLTLSQVILVCFAPDNLLHLPSAGVHVIAISLAGEPVT